MHTRSHPHDQGSRKVGGAVKKLIQVHLDRELMKLVDKFAIDRELKRGPAMEILLRRGLEVGR